MDSPTRELKPSKQFWRARKRLGITQEELAYLLGHKTTGATCRFERGKKLPHIKQALQLESILGVPLKVLFQDVYQHEQRKVEQRLEQASQRLKSLLARSKIPIDICTYADVLEEPQPTLAERKKLHEHIVQITRREAYL